MKDVVTTFIGLLVVPVLFFHSSTAASPGNLDPTFGNGGIVSTALPYNRIAQDRLGRIVLAMSSGFAVTRLNRDGTLDTTFGAGGTVTLTLGSSREFLDIALQPDGKIVLAGWIRFVEEAGEFAVVRLTASGQLDSSFGNNGVSRTPWGVKTQAYAVDFQSNGKIVVAGMMSSPTIPNDRDPFVIRLDQRGNLDPGFGTAGRSIVSRPIDDWVLSMAVQPDGKIVLGGQSWAGAEGNDFSVHRLNPNGSIDTSFGGDGSVETQIAPLSDDRAWSVAIQPSGKIVLGGNCFRVRYEVCMARFEANGDLDSTFGSAGRVLTPVSSQSTGHTVLSQTNGKIVIVGSSYNGSISRATLVRYDTNGGLDAGFGTGGVVYAPLASPGPDYGALQVDGKILVTSGANGGAAFRYNGDPVLVPTATRFDFDGDGRADQSVFRPETGMWFWTLSSSGMSASVPFGLHTDQIVPADYDGDSKTDVAVFRDGLWYVLRSSDFGVAVYHFGLPGDVPVPADYDGDGRSDYAVFRNGIWYILRSSDNGFRAQAFGLAGDRPIVADFDGDSRSDLAVYRDGVWYVNGSFNGLSVHRFGLASDRPVAADYDGDQIADFAVYRSGQWYIERSSAGFTVVNFGISTDDPVPADYDGDGKDDIAVYRSGVWWILKTTGGVTNYHFGLAGDRSIPAAFLR